MPALLKLFESVAYATPSDLVPWRIRASEISPSRTARWSPAIERPVRSRLLRKPLSFFAASALEASPRHEFVFLSAAKNGFWRTTFGLHFDAPASLTAFATKAAARAMAFTRSPAFAGAG